MFASVGCAATVLIAPTTSLLGITFSTCPFWIGPGPWALHVPPITMLTEITAGGCCSFPLLSTARIMMNTRPGVVGVQLKLHVVVPVALYVALSIDTSTRATVPPPASLAVPVMLTVVPGNISVLVLGDVIVEVGSVVSRITMTITSAGGFC